MSLSDCCFKTIDHEGETVGSYKTISGLDTYQVGAEFGNEKLIVILTDVFGYKYKNNKLVADELSRQGKVQVLVPDILQGDAVADLATFKREIWFKDHHPSITGPIVADFLKSLREEAKPTFLGGIGHCFGAKFVISQITENGLFDAGAVAHPSLTTPEDYEAIKKPIVISAAAIDNSYNKELREQSIDTLTKNETPYQITVFQGVSHGFAIRGDPSNKIVQYAQGKVIQDQIQFFQLHS